ncbi:MAG: glycosyltransferase [Muribaculaceae bacterium]|nr:glycosyltransferase [Muribaculaceae bacterium]
MKKKILFTIDSLGIGGAEKSLISLLPLLNSNKYIIDLMIISRGGTFEQYIPQNVNIIDYKPHNNKFIQVTIFKLLKLWFSFILRFNKLIKKKRHGAELYWSIMHYAIRPIVIKYDIAIAYQQGFPTYYVASKVNASKKIAWINADITNVGYREKFNQIFYNKFDYIVPVSKRLKDIITAKYNFAHKTIVILDIINPELINIMAEQPIKTYNESIILTTVARLVPQKGHYLAVEVARILNESGLKFLWYFVGDGPCRNKIQSLIKKYNLEAQIKLLGLQSNPYPYIRACDIYVQPSISEGFGITIAEAKILKKPIVSTNFDVVHDQLINEVNGLIVNKNEKEIANAILRLINNPILKETLTHNLKQVDNKTYITESDKVMSLIDA